VLFFLQLYHIALSLYSQEKRLVLCIHNQKTITFSIMLSSCQGAKLVWVLALSSFQTA